MEIVWPERFNYLSTLIFLGAFACSENNNSVVNGYVNHSIDIWKNKNLSVCFEGEGFELDRLTVKNSVIKEFLKAGFNFSGWESCGSIGSDIRVAFSSVSTVSRTLAYGEAIKGIQSGVLLSVVDGCLLGFSGSHCEENNAIHEFGHVLGLHHEMNRRDNPSCSRQQLDASGESSAVQIGDYDTNSIMNYCNLADAAEKNEYLGLSIGDLGSLEVLYAQPFAYLEKNPSALLKPDDFQFKVKSKYGKFYRYKIAGLDAANCSDIAGYSPPIGIDSILQLPDELLNEKYSGRLLKLCLLGGDNLIWQNKEFYSSYDFALENTVDHDGPELRSLHLDVNTSANSGLTLSIKCNDESEIVSFEPEFIYEEQGFQPHLPRLKSIRQANRNSLLMNIPWDTFPINGHVYLKSLVITDINENKSTWIASKELDHGLQRVDSNASPSIKISNFTYEISNAATYVLDRRSIEEMTFEKLIFTRNDELQIRLKVTEKSEIKTLRLKVSQVGSKVTRTFYADDRAFKKIGKDIYLISLPLERWTSQGLSGKFIVQNLDLYDIFENKTSLIATTLEDEYFNGTNLQIPFFVFSE